MAIGNVNSILSMLRRMSDTPDNPELQRYAQLHKNDPFILPLVIGEDTARKEMRAAQQARMMGNDPRKVNDQAIAAIGQQPVPSQGAGPAPAGLPTLRTGMANMADGGIAGYPDEDEVVGMAEGGVARYNGATGSLTSALEQAQMPVMQNLQSLQAQLGQAEQMLAAAAKSGDPQSLNYYAQAVQALRTQLATVAEQNFGNRAAEVMSGLSAAPAAVPTRQGKTGIADIDVGPSMAPAAAAPAAAPRPGPGAATRPVAAAPAAAAPSPAMAMEKPTPEAAKLTAAQFLDKQAEEKRLADYQSTEEKRIAEELTQTQEALKREDKAGAGLEALLKKEEEGSKGRLEQAKAFSIIKAGLAMAAGQSSNALQNIARGLGVGFEDYENALDKFDKAAKERQKAFASIEDARRAEARDDLKAKLAAQQRASDAFAQVRKFSIQGSMELGVKNADIAAKAFDSAMTQYGATQRTLIETGSREREGAAGRQTQVQIANIQAGTRDSPLALYRELGDGDIKRGFEIAQEGKVGGSLIKAIVEGVLKNPLMMREYPPAVQQLVNQELLKLGVSSGVTSNPPANAQILK